MFEVTLSKLTHTKLDKFEASSEKKNFERIDYRIYLFIRWRIGLRKVQVLGL